MPKPSYKTGSVQMVKSKKKTAKKVRANTLSTSVGTQTVAVFARTVKQLQSVLGLDKDQKVGPYVREILNEWLTNQPTNQSPQLGTRTDSYDKVESRPEVIELADLIASDGLEFFSVTPVTVAKYVGPCCISTLKGYPRSERRIRRGDKIVFLKAQRNGVRIPPIPCKSEFESILHEIEDYYEDLDNRECLDED